MSTPDLKVLPVEMHVFHISSITHTLFTSLAHMELNINIIMTNLIEPKIQKLINPVLNNNLFQAEYEGYLAEPGSRV